MEHPSLFDRPEPAPRSPGSERFSGRGSGTRRISTLERGAAASEAPTQRSSTHSRIRRWARRALDLCWQLDGRLRGRLLWSWGAVAATSGGALPLMASWAGESSLGAHAAVWLPFVALLLAGFTWLARCRPKAGGEWALEIAQQRLAGLLRLSALDVRSLVGAPKSLALSTLSRFALGAGFAVLAVASTLDVAQRLVGYVAGSVLTGLSLWSASLLFGSELLRWAVRVQTEQDRPPLADLALAVQEFSGLVELSSPLELETIFLNPTALHSLMEGLSTWRPEGQWHTAQDHAAALQRHLWGGCMPYARLELQRWLGARRAQGVADLVIDDSVLIDFQIGLDLASAQQVVERVQRYQQSWDRPIVLVLCNADGGQPLQADAIELLLAARDPARTLVAVAR